MTSSLEQNQLVEFYQFLQRSHSGPIPIKKGVTLTGKQPCGTWVLNHETFISSSGLLIEPQDTDLVFINKDVIYESDRILNVDITPLIKLPLSSDPLASLVTTMEVMFKHNFIPSLIILSGIITAFHYEAVARLYGGCPMMIALGEAETGKSTAIRAGLALAAMDEKGRFVKITNAALMERACRSTLPFCVEEVQSKQKSKTNSLDFSDAVINLYCNSRSYNLKTGPAKPKSVPIAASNFDVDKMERLAVLYA